MQDMKDPIQGTLDAVREVDFRVRQVRLLWSEAERASAAEVETLRAELARKDEDVERFRARAEQELKRLRRSNEQVREVLGANHDESPVEAAERAVAERQNKEYMGREIERLRAEREKERAETAQLLQAERQALRESIAAVRAERDKALARVEELERLVPVEGGVRPMNASVTTDKRRCRRCEATMIAKTKDCYSARQVARNECASALFRILRPTKEPPQQGTYVFNTALAEIIEEINALRKDREALNRVRSAVEEKP
jgi:uncharacterized protein with von Willebrand factor type A (vWA) domain